ncbi:prolipoprotein diacylglyceryl transferase [Rhodospirillum rubrum]|uniref:Phosphatidylglycerol--prolipoprotein diacylglyceryl transferase n=1 Tax=Rhodospirillum rubrum (strain ATCC 11170 / ATH 1.1.1 / DSM 467 / LMG 4362 / NCIMB 8255 / S1) TaxID=269796 RepID=LGT_RHORT|nr:prolipoprotein diacylglyceryl transferase [Rhodospirillum rubrum]Q2RWQ0.1 RecName: Full=Phosphatidylglycerol--prolipoprotein diacylglyceryl transferase [Rhodospirillum rubrum ATCC 11170]ABC21445.1 Prolipoprotein diacylglyceryl transferase [Rhodospirillum rubrum ATCC 11170]AEO47127.1 prolipoprotein diacylglyceryl transferase [Rhodospirillum rubrum F11]MBK5953039.1 prolipoprotein diacylglyceryl transferase [Rhodospirillum rubrum]QXG81120.1 prolipoprotein diacylglyceryl transferase [Rhodospiri
MLFALPFPAIDPVLVEIGPFAIRWYALAYIVGLLGGWWYTRFLSRRSRPPVMSDADVDDLLVWATLGTILGGRLGYVVFYNAAHFLANPLEIPMLWHGGMSFHGGLVGVITATVLFCRSRRLSVARVGDLVALVAPLGLFFGRLANFINGELFGRPAPDVPWAMVFPHGGPLPRHPSQLYEATLEGLVLFCLLGLLWRFTALSRKPGQIIGLFLIGYGLSRITAEFFREPDAQIGFLALGVTMGQILSLPMILAGIVVFVVARRAKPLAVPGGR